MAALCCNYLWLGLPLNLHLPRLDCPSHTSDQRNLSTMDPREFQPKIIRTKLASDRVDWQPKKPQVVVYH